MKAYIEYRIISVIVQQARRRGKPSEVCVGGRRARMAQVTNTRDQTCCTVTTTLERTSPSPACRISSRAAV